MSFKKKRAIFLFFWFFLLSLSPFTVLRNLELEKVFANDLLTVNFFQRILGLVSFTLLFSQIMLGSMMEKWIKLLGGWAYKFHITEGVFTYLVIFLHPFMQTIIDFKSRGLVAAVLTFLPGRDLYLNLGKISFLLITLGVLAGYFRTKPFFRRNWKKFHYLNYFAFFLVAIHSWNLGSDVLAFPFNPFYWLALVLVTYSTLRGLILKRRNE